MAFPAGKPPTMTSSTVIANELFWKGNKAAFVLAPTGLALGHNGTLYVAETPSNHITAISNALSPGQSRSRTGAAPHLRWGTERTARDDIGTQR